MKQFEKDITTLAAIAAFIIFWPRIKEFVSYTRSPEFDDGEIDIDTADACKHIIYQPLSMSDIHSSDILPDGYCYRGDSFWKDKPHSTGDQYADDQADKTLAKFDTENILEKMDYMVINLQNTLDESVDFDVVNATTDPASFGGSSTSTPAVTIVTSTVGTFQINLAGIGDVSINWGDGVIETETLGAEATYSHTYTAGGTITITGVDNITVIDVQNDSDVTSVDVPSETVNITEIDLSNTSITSLDTFATWTAIISIDVSVTSLTSLDTFAAWTALLFLLVNNTSLTEIETHPEWVDILIINASNTSISSFSTFSSWISIIQIGISYTSVSTFTTFAAWTALQVIFIDNTSISALTTHAEWVNLNQLKVNSTSISALTTHAEWVNLLVLDISNTSISALTTHAEWVNIRILNISSTSISALTTHVEWVNIRTLSLHNTSLSSLTTYAEWTDLRTLAIYLTLISSLTTYAAWALLQSLIVNDTSITNLIAHSAWTSILTFNLSNNAIVSATNINNELIALEAAGMSSGTVDLSGGTNAAPTGAGITAKNNLISAGVSVTTN